MPPPELPVITRSPYRLPRKPGSGLAMAPVLPFSDPAAVVTAAGSVGTPVTGPAPHLLTVTCAPAELGALATQLAETGVGDLRVVVRVDTAPPAVPHPAAVRRFATAGVAGMEFGSAVELAEEHLADWFEFGKACLTYGLPLTWSGELPQAAVEHWAHLPPPRNQPEWRRRWRYGSLGWRRGPGFVSVVDSRGADIHQRRIKLESLTPVFGDRLDTPVPASSIPDTALDALRAAGLAAVFGARAVWLPYRLRRWPPNTLLL